MPLQARKTLAVTGSTQPKDGFFTHSIGRRAILFILLATIGFFAARNYWNDYSEKITQQENDALVDQARQLVSNTDTYQKLVAPVYEWARLQHISFEAAQEDLYRHRGIVSYKLQLTDADFENKSIVFSYPVKAPPFEGAVVQDFMLSQDSFIVELKTSEVYWGDKNLPNTWRKISKSGWGNARLDPPEKTPKAPKQANTGWGHSNLTPVRHE